jgi:hypothetical protein
MAYATLSPYYGEVYHSVSAELNIILLQPNT